MTSKEWIQARNDMSTAEGKLRWQRMPDLEKLEERPNVRTIWILVKVAGFIPIPLAPIRVDGVQCKGWSFQPMQEAMS